MMRNITGLLLSTTTLLVLSVVFPQPVWAGQGSITDGRLDITVYFTYEETDFASWEPVFREFSLLLYNSTERQLQLGTVSFTNEAEHKLEADVWVLDNNDGAMAHLDGLGVDGRHITISQTHKSVSGSARGQFGLTHESGHYLWGLRDEYLGFIGTKQVGCNSCSDDADPVHHPCVNSDSDVCSVMDGGTTTRNNDRHEFCTPANGTWGATRHNSGGTNADGQPVQNGQEYYHSMSCWELMVESGVGDLEMPSQAPTDSTVGHSAVNFESLDGTASFVIVLDRSGSMAQLNRLLLAKEGGKIAAGLLRDGQRVAVLSFDHNVSTNLALATVSAAVKTTATEEIDDIVTGGQTAIGDALLAAQQQFNGVESSENVVILLSDGASNTGTGVDQAAATLRDAGTRLYAIGVGENADPDALSSAAKLTGGRYFAAQTSSKLRGTFARIVTEAMGREELSEAVEQELSSGQSRSHTFVASEFSDSLVVSLGFTTGTDVGLTLREPSGTVITTSTQRSDVDVFKGDAQVVFEIRNPQKGPWRATVTAPSGGASSYDYDLAASIDTRRLSVTAHVGDESLAYPTPVHIEVAVTAGAPVVGAEVTAQVIDPDGVALAGTLLLRDSGAAADGDEDAGDGIYSALFHAFTKEGSYTFLAKVVNVNGHTSSLHECGPAATLAEQGSTAESVAAFTATTSASATVVNVPFLSGPGNLTLSSVADDLDGQVVRKDRVVMKPLLDVVLEASDDETLLVRTLDLSARDLKGSAAAGAEFGLYVDTDEDGLLDAPALPLATARVQTGNRLVFQGKTGGDLIAIQEGHQVRLLIVMTDLPDSLSAGAASPRPPVPFRPEPPHVPVGPGVLAALALLLMGVIARVRQRAPSPPAALGAYAVAVVCLVVVLTMPGCGGGGGGGGVIRYVGGGGGGGGGGGSTTSTFVLSLSADDVDAYGARSGITLAPSGLEVSATTRLSKDGGDGRVQPGGSGQGSGDDHGDIYSEGTLVLPPQSVGGAIETPEDPDWFRVPVQAGRRYILRTELNTLDDSVLTVVDDGAVIIAENDDSPLPGGDLESYVDITPARTMVLGVRVKGFDKTDLGTYRLIIEMP